MRQESRFRAITSATRKRRTEMKRFLGVLSLTGALVLVGIVAAHAAEQKKAAAAPKSVTMTGEIVDTGCYLGHEAKGEKHKECAATCVAAGMPIGLLTDKNALYLLIPPHENKDGYNKAKEMVGDKAEISGMPLVRGGLRAIEVASAKPVAAEVKAPAATTVK